jgi:hypothetical protein
MTHDERKIFAELVREDIASRRACRDRLDEALKVFDLEEERREREAESSRSRTMAEAA